MGYLSIEEKRKKLEEMKRKIIEVGLGDAMRPYSGEFEGLESLYDLMLWNLGPMEAIATMITLEIEANSIPYDDSFYSIDLLVNDLRIKIEDLREIIETWINGELQGRLKSCGESTSPIGIFVKDCCVLNRDYQVEPKDLYEEYQKWCRKSRNKALIRGRFYEKLLLHFPSIKEKQSEDGMKRVYAGIGI